MEMFSLPYHRASTFPGPQGRLRFPIFIDNKLTSYEAKAGKNHWDVAARYSHSFGPIDVGLSVFEGTSREPFLKLMANRYGTPVFAPYYEIIRQWGLDSQLNVKSWIFKLETIQRTGSQNLIGKEEDYTAATFGGEYTFYSLWNSNVDMTLFSEWNYDGRGKNATNTFQNDFFFAIRLAFNNVQSMEWTTGILET